MIDLKELEKILKEIEENNLFNTFFTNLFDYSEVELNKLIIRYFFDNGFIIDIFDYNKNNKFIRYNFNDNENGIVIDENIIIYNINLKYIYMKNDGSKYYFFSSLFYEKNEKLLINNLFKLFDRNIAKIFLCNMS